MIQSCYNCSGMEVFHANTRKGLPLSAGGAKTLYTHPLRIVGTAKTKRSPAHMQYGTSIQS